MAETMNNSQQLPYGVQERDYYALLQYLPGMSTNTTINRKGYKEEMLGVEVFTRSGVEVLRISGTLCCFVKEFALSVNCDTNNITYKFKDGVLYVMQPLIVPARQDTPAIKTDQEQAAMHHTTQEKPVPNREAKSSKDEQKIRESEGTKKEERDKTGEGQKAHENMPGKIDVDHSENEGSNDENRSYFVPPSDFISEKEFNTLLIYLPGFKEEQLDVQVFTRSGSGVLKISATLPCFRNVYPLTANCDTKNITYEFKEDMLYVEMPLIDPPREDTPGTEETSPVIKTDQENEQTINESEGTEKEGRGKTGSIHDDDQNAHENLSGKIDADQSTNNGTNYGTDTEKADDYKLETPKLKMGWPKMTMLLSFLFAFAVGMYIQQSAGLIF